VRATGGCVCERIGSSIWSNVSRALETGRRLRIVVDAPAVVALTDRGRAGIDPAPCRPGSRARVSSCCRPHRSTHGSSPHVEAHVPAPQPEPLPHPRVSCPQGDRQWSQSGRSPSSTWSQAADRDDRRQMKPEGFPAAVRLRKRREFLQIQGAGAKLHLRHFLVFVSTAASPQLPRRTGDEALVRLGVTVTRKVGPAVVRNRIKRFVREAFRRKRGSFTPGCDMVWVAKQSAASVGYAEVAAAMDAMTRRVPPGASC